MTRKFVDDLDWALGLVADAFTIGRTRRDAEHVAAVLAAPHGVRGPVDVSLRSKPLGETLDSIRRGLVTLIAERETPAPPEYRIEWRSTPPSPVPSVVDEEPPPPQLNMRDPQPVQTEIATSSGVVNAAMELCDWLNRVREDERISHEGAIRGAHQKSNALLSALGIEKIDRTGLFDNRDQQIVDCVTTDSPDADMQVYSTVQCGYRWNDQIVRPQRVMVYRWTGKA